jgi:two-component system, sensor histidine kinase and response regulator
MEREETRMEDRGKILIVDDERDLVEMLSYNLRKKGYGTASAHDGFEAWSKLEPERPDLLILDLMMPGLDGWELCRLIRGHELDALRETGILMLTARAAEEDRIYGLNLGADDYLTKPFSVSELVLRVDKMMEKRKKTQRLSQALSELRREIDGREANMRRVVHDIKNPLLSMGLSAKRLLRKERQEEDARFLGLIHENSVQLSHWVEDALKFSDLSSQKWKDEMRPADPVSVVEKAVDSAAEIAQGREIELHFARFESEHSVVCHEHLLRRAVDNLLFNALKYTPRGGRVEVSVTFYFAKGGHGVAEISFKDTGIGIPLEESERIFEPYYRGKNAGMGEGLGLGLSFAREVVDLHGGKILLDSTLGKGSVFSILLPAGRQIMEKEVNDRFNQNVKGT